MVKAVDISPKASDSSLPDAAHPNHVCSANDYLLELITLPTWSERPSILLTRDGCSRLLRAVLWAMGGRGSQSPPSFSPPEQQHGRHAGCDIPGPAAASAPIHPARRRGPGGVRGQAAPAAPGSSITSSLPAPDLSL